MARTYPSTKASSDAIDAAGALTSATIVTVALPRCSARKRPVKCWTSSASTFGQTWPWNRMASRRLPLHTERRAIYRDRADGVVKREATDTALEALVEALSGVECREVSTRSGDLRRDYDEPVRILAFGAARERLDGLASLSLSESHRNASLL